VMAFTIAVRRGDSDASCIKKTSLGIPIIFPDEKKVDEDFEVSVLMMDG
jgi:hypothetical protein